MNNRLFDQFPDDQFLNQPHGSSIADVQPGTMLIASPALADSPYRRCVVLVLQNNDDGTFGVVLNRPANEDIKSAWQGMTGTSEDNRNIVQGGPIGGPVFAIHQKPAIAELAVPGGVFVTSQSDKFQQLIDQDDAQYRIVFGIAGWKQGQLQNEIESGLWFEHHADLSRIFDNPEFMWERSLRQYGRKMLADTIGLNSIPIDPLLN